MKKISVIVPIYNVEIYIRKCIDSILNQTYKNIEVILIEDGSPDKCGMICDEYAEKDNRIVVIHKKNEGVSASRNTGLNIATGQYIAFVDADDYIHPKMYEVLMSISSLNNTQISACNISFVDNNTDTNYKETMQIPSSSLLSSDDFFKKMLNCKEMIRIGIWNKIFRSDIIGNIRFHTDLKMAEDIVFLIQVLFKTDQISYIPASYYYYTEQRDGAATQCSYGLLEKQRFLGFQRIIKYISENRPNLLNNIIVYKCINADLIAISKMIISKEKDKKTLEYVRKELKENYIKIIRSNISSIRKIQISTYILSPCLYYKILSVYFTLRKRHS